MNREIKQFFVFLIKAIVIVLIVDMSIGLLFRFLYNRMVGGERARAHYVINKSADDVLIMGSSRAWNHYIPQVIEDSLGLTVYNAGRSAQSLLYQKTLLKMFLPRHQPKIIILDINENDLVFEARKYEIFGSLMPYYATNEAFREEFDRVNPQFKYFGWLNTVVYNSSLFSIFYRSLKPKEDLHKGFQALVGERVSRIEMVDNCSELTDVDPQMRLALHEIISLCENHNIRLICVLSPRAVDFKCVRRDYQSVKNELARKNVYTIDFTNNQKFRSNLTLMRDPAHLNGKGALEFSKDIAHIIKGELRN
jgi:hypothetical protein